MFSVSLLGASGQSVTCRVRRRFSLPTLLLLVVNLSPLHPFLSTFPMCCACDIRPSMGEIYARLTCLDDDEMGRNTTLAGSYV
mmetsp:Transcript_6631/g.20013  ORF Transcript_6631/g.20013 Transcript_6631/m.20013 type:complete len:83 (-) Transcript_6631:16-264(-)